MGPAVSTLLLVCDADAPSELVAALAGAGVELRTARGRALLAAILEGTPCPRVEMLVAVTESADVWAGELVVSLRAAADGTPLVAAVRSGGREARVGLLEAGADDVVSGELDVEELLARVHAVHRRSRSIPVLRVGELSIDLGRRQVRVGERPVDVSPKEFDLLHVLAEARGRVCTRSELLREVWGRDRDPGTAVVEVLVARLRRKLRVGRRSLIRTAHGRGYRIDPSVDPAP